MPFDRFFSAFSLCIYFNASGICDRINGTILPAQCIFIFHFQPYDSLIISSGKAQHLTCQCIVRIIPFIIFIHLYAAKIRFPDPVTGFFLHITFDPFDRGNLLHSFPDCFFVHGKLPAKQLDHCFRIFDL